MPFVMWLLGEREMKAREATLCGHQTPGVEGLTAASGLPETEILRFKAQTFKIHPESVLSWAGWLLLVLIFFKGKIAS